MDKKKNHYVPRCLLKRWSLNNGTYDGVFVLNCLSKTINFSSAKGNKGFSFASIDNLYILDKNDVRYTNLEDWFSGLENTLSIFIDKVVKRETTLFKDSAQLYKALMGLLSFEFRSRYLFQEGIKFIESNSKISAKFAGKSSLQILLENSVNATTNKVNQLFPVEFTVCNSAVPLLICDRPLLYNAFDGYSFIPLSPYLLLSFRKSQGQSTIAYHTIDDKTANSFNKQIIEAARDWIVSTNREELERISKSEKFEYSDEIIFEEFRTLIYGYEY
ncbi:hypothetical protein SDC9_32313 [bioreactor metagenome]|uniref:DUF4238 domain-containing protein n=1 Tax=bioreactor metagenome TaxID=1076179 RepID=A0A644V691_9ZZZZ|nr:DUF4238 domain-containing protein [Macellibacteroides fermentans]